MELDIIFGKVKVFKNCKVEVSVKWKDDRCSGLTGVYVSLVVLIIFTILSIKHDKSVFGRIFRQFINDGQLTNKYWTD